MAKRQECEARKEEIDRISSLPDFILTDILSHLPLCSAVATSVLSRRWRYLWTHLTHLNFHPSGIRYRNYVNTFNRLLPQFTSPKIHSFRLVINYIPITEDKTAEDCSSSIQSWIAAICNRFVERIEFHIHVTCRPFVAAPSCMFRCQSLTSLSLHGCFCYDGLIVFSLPNLKKLDFVHHVLESLFLDRLLESCPLLEDLSLQFDFWDVSQSLDLSTLCLKKLRIVMFKCKKPPQGKLVVNASKLEDIKLSGLCLPRLGFIKPFGALRTADMLLMRHMMMDNCHSNAVEFAELMSSAASLRLNFSAFKTLINLDDCLLPILDNLSDLNLKFDGINWSWNDLLRLLRYAPRLVCLTLTLKYYGKQALDWAGPHCTPPCGLSNLKKIHIEQLQGNSADYKMMEYILSNAKVLKLLSIHLCVPFRRKDTTLWKEYGFCEKLFLLERPSACEIKCSGQYLTISSTRVKNKRPHCQSIRLGDHLVV